MRRVSIFFMAHEDEQGRLTTSAGTAPAWCFYNDGLGQHYPPASGAGYVLDVSAYDQAALQPGLKPHGPFPLVVRFDSITVQGISEGRTVQDLVRRAEYMLFRSMAATTAKRHVMW
ncbi:hypothetical protein WJX73_004076 [Symbiochloris irregularis]|uniref:Uncharacterized protein n=1 Tax=Symbiochloris irregularis TaxID=706552 RepID=A0AAW1NWD4_9CHLO